MRNYHGMKRCRYCAHWQPKAPSLKGWLDMWACRSEHAQSPIAALANYCCEGFTSGGLLPEAAIEVVMERHPLPYKPYLPSTRENIALCERFLNGELTKEQRESFYRWNHYDPETIKSIEAELALNGDLWIYEYSKEYFKAHAYAGSQGLKSDVLATAIRIAHEGMMSKDEARKVCGLDA